MGMLGLYPHKCRQCGKEFEGRREYAFKVPKRPGWDKYYYFCSHKCFRAYENSEKGKGNA